MNNFVFAYKSLCLLVSQRIVSYLKTNVNRNNRSSKSGESTERARQETVCRKNR